jgi:hypothetical protein
VGSGDSLLMAGPGVVGGAALTAARAGVKASLAGWPGDRSCHKLSPAATDELIKMVVLRLICNIILPA